MKKLLVLILVIAMMLNLVACKSECEKNGHSDGDTNGICDVCQATTIDYEKPSLVGAILKNNIEKQLDELQSFKFEFSLESKNASSEWDAVYVEGEGDVLVERVTDEIDRQSVELWANRNGDSFDARIVTKNYTFYKETSSDGDFSDYEDELESLSYVIDGYVYNEMADGSFNKQKVPTDRLDEILKKLASAEILSEDKKNDLLNALGAEVATILKLRDNAGSVNVDLKGSADELLAYIAALNFETDTVGKVINDALALVSEDLTAEAVITELERIGALTVNEALAELDAWLTENHGTTVQGIIDSIVGSPELIEACEDILLMINDVDESDTELQETIAGMIEEVKTFNIANFIAENQLGELTVYEIFVSIIGGGMPERDEFFTDIRSILDMTLGAFDENLSGGTLSKIKMTASMITVDALNFKVDAKFRNILELSELSGEFNLGISTTIPSDVEGKNDTTRVTDIGSFKLYDISNEPIVIALEEGSVVVDSNLIDGEFTAENGFLEFDSYTYGDDVYVDVSGEYIDSAKGYVIEFTAWSVPLRRILADEIILDDVTLELNGETLEINGPAVIRLTVDAENDTFTFVSMPNYVTKSIAYTAFLELAYNNFYNTPTEGYSMVAGATPSGFDPSDIYIDFTDYPLSFVYFSVEEGDDEYTLICTLTGFGTDSKHAIHHPTNGTGGYGGYYYEDNPEAFLLFFGGDITFEIVLDPETGVFSFVDYPMIEDQYKNNWPQ